MRKKDVKIKGLMRVSELVKAAGVSLTTIHYYTREGLLSPSIKTAHNMAYYSQDCVEDIRIIKELQAKKFLPLSVIKQVVLGRREGQAIDHIIDLESLLVEIFQPLSGEAKPKNISLAELLSASELSESSIKDLEDREFIVPVETENGPAYDDIDIRIAQIFKRLAEFGLEPRDLGFYHQYIQFTRTEFEAMHETFHQHPNHEIISLNELFKISNDLKAYLALRIYRQETQRMHQHGFDKGADR